MTRRAVYGMGGKVDLKKLNRDIRSDIKNLKNVKKNLSGEANSTLNGRNIIMNG